MIQKKITVIGHAIDTDRFTPTKVRRTKNLVILFVGRFEEEKGILDFIEAAKILAKQFPVRFRVIGTGSKRHVLPNFIEQREVSYKQIQREYQAADIFVAPSKPTKTWDEQYNTALLEAQASGLPIVTTKTGGITENVGDAVLLVPSGKVSELTAAIQSFIVDEKKRMEYSKRARKRALTVHDSRVVAKRMADLYDQVMSKK